MPRKKRTIVEETIPDATESGEDITDVVCVLTKVYKLNAGSRSFCFQTTEPVDEVMIQAQYATGGKFVVIAYNALNHVISTEHIDIEPKPLAVGAANGGGEDIRSRMLLEELAFTRNMMLQLINGLVSNKQQTAAASTPLGELAQAMTLIHGLSPQTNAADLILKGMDLGMKANGNGGDWKTALVDTAKEIAPAVVSVIGAARTTQPQQGITMIQTTPVGLIKQGIDWLKPKIIGGMETGLAVGWVIQNANDPICQQLLSHAAQGIDAFIAVDPELNNEPYKTWFTTAINQLKEWYAAQSADQTDNDGGNGDGTDVADDATVSAGKPQVFKVS